MKSWIVVPLIVLGAVSLRGQTLYRVPADTKGNTIVLTVANEPQSTAAQTVSLRPVGSHKGTTVSPSVVTVKSLQAEGSSDVTFTFDVGRDVKVNQRDTLDFEIRDKVGEVWTKSIVVEYAGPHAYKLDQNFPNPFNPTTTIYYDLPVESKVSLRVYDILGKEVRALVDDSKEAGFYSARFDVRNLASGPYLYRLVAQPVGGGKTFSSVKKGLVLK